MMKNQMYDVKNKTLNELENKYLETLDSQRDDLIGLLIKVLLQKQKKSIFVFTV